MTKPRLTPSSRLLVACCLLAMIGCAAPTAPKPKAEVVAPRQDVQKYVPYAPATQAAPVASAAEELPLSPRDPQPSPALLYHVDLWELLLPLNSISGDEAFWKRVDESVIDIATHDQLDKNGIRVGALPTSDANFLTSLVEQRKGKKTTIQGRAEKQVELAMGGSVDRQSLLYIDRRNSLVGRSYDKSQNLFYFSFEPSPRRPNQIRLALTPAVRGEKKKLTYSLIGKADRELKYTNEESHYDANLVVDLPLSSMLIVAPSLESRWESSLGGAFLVSETQSQQFERVLVIIPRAFQPAAEAVSAK